MIKGKRSHKTERRTKERKLKAIKIVYKEVENRKSSISSSIVLLNQFICNFSYKIKETR